jgi:RND family efflux transporter MFP subunit
MDMREEQRQIQPAAPPAHDGNHGPPAHDDPDALPADLPKVGTGRVLLITLAFAAVFAGLFLLGYLPHRRQQAKLHEESQEAQDARPVVNVDHPRRGPQTIDLTLPADAHANQATAIYPRANGYIKRLLVDIGARVTDGQLLAEIDTPEVDAQLNQARATLEQGKANVGKAQNDFDLAQKTLERYTGFAKTGGVTQQQLDEKRSAFAQAKAILEAAKATVSGSQAEVQRLEAIQGYEKVTAPFGGTITARNYDLGALLSPTNTGNRELFRIDQIDVLRVYANVPQNYATTIKVGEKASFFVRNYPGRAFTGTVARTAGAIDPQTRTLRVEVELANADGALFSGMYGQIRFHVTQAQPPLVVPSSALVYNAQGTRVAVAVNGKVQFRKVELGRDLGNEIEVASGLGADELVVSNPGERLIDGIEVNVSMPKAGTATAEAPAPKKAEPEALAR